MSTGPIGDQALQVDRKGCFFHR